MSILETVLSHETVVPMEKLTEITVEEDTNCLELDMTNNRWAEFNFVVLRIHPVSDSAKGYYGRVNGSSSNSLRFSDLAANSSSVGFMLMGNWSNDALLVYFTCKGRCQRLVGIGVSTSLYCSSITMPLSDIQKITFGEPDDPAGTVKAGSTIEVWGVM